MKSCRNLVAPAKGRKSSNDSNCGATVTFRCDERYELQGLEELSCLENRTWTGVEPNCSGQFIFLLNYLHVGIFFLVVTSCPNLVTPRNGTLRLTAGHLIGSAAWFDCDDGYGLIGSAYRDCIAGRWRGVKTSCHSMSVY